MNTVCPVSFKKLLLLKFLLLVYVIKGFTQVPTALITKVSDNVIYLDATELDDFHEGFAIIRKGENFAIIDKYGKVLIPYEKYNFTGVQGRIDTRTCGFKNGMCAVQDPNTEKYGFINLKGNLTVPCSFTYVQPFTEDGYAWLEEGDQYNKKYFFVDKSGKKFPVVKNQRLSNPSILKMYRINTGEKLIEFYDKTGRLVMKTSRKVTGDYSDGLIKVDSSFQMAGDKVGFIDIHNKLVIPYKFKGRVMDFHEGLAYYEPTVRDEYMYAYMDKTGNPVIKMKVTDKIKAVSAFGYENFQSGYAHCEVNREQRTPRFIDKQGNIIQLTDNLQQENTFFINQFKNFKPEFLIYDNPRKEDMIQITGLMTFTIPEKLVTSGFGGGKTIIKDKQIDYTGFGIAQISGKFILPPIFSKIGFPDSVSGLAKATITKDMNGNYYNGYVDNTGKFTILTTYKP